MRIGINLLFLIPNQVGGTETYATFLIDALLSHYCSDTFILFCNNENYPHFKTLFGQHSNVEFCLLPLRASNKFNRLMFEQTIFLWYVWKSKIDVLHSPGYIQPFFAPTKKVVGILDLNWYYHPEDFGLFERLAWKILVIGSAKTADKIITISNTSARSISSILAIPSVKISVTHISVAKLPQPNSYDTLIAIGIHRPFMLTVSSQVPHKNLLTLLRAYAKISQIDHKLQFVIVGLGGRAKGDILNFIKCHPELSLKIKILGWVSTNMLATLYHFASVFAFPSKYEGFGLPILEAFSFKTPVVSSYAFSLREVVGNGGILVNPTDVNNWVKSITNVVSNPQYSSELKKRGLKQLEKFSWKKTATKTYAVYSEVVHVIKS